MRRRVALVAAACAGAGCRSATDVCTLEARPAISLTVQDSVTGAPALAGARITVREGGFVVTSDVPEGAGAGAVGLVEERAGTYTVAVEQAGYRPWERAGVRVGADQCHVRTVALTARLQR